MFTTDRDALTCDLAETYRIYDYKALPIDTLATLCCGLRADSRIKMKMAGLNDLPFSAFAARIADNLTVIRHVLTGDKKLDENLLLSNLLTQNMEAENKVAFSSGDEFMKWRSQFVGDNNDG